MKKTITINFRKSATQSQSLRIRIPTQSVTVDQIIPSLHTLFDEIIEMELQGRKTACQVGCSACCNQLIPLSIPEVFHLCDVIASLPPKPKTVIRNRIRFLADSIRKTGLLNDLYTPRISKNIDSQYFDLGLACPFLEKKSCSIYEHRPFACREYHVESSAILCRKPYTNDIKKIKISWNIGALLAAFSFRLYGMPPNPIPLPLVLNWRKKHKDLMKLKWPGTWMFEKITDCLPKINNQAGITIFISST